MVKVRSPQGSVLDLSPIDAASYVNTLGYSYLTDQTGATQTDWSQLTRNDQPAAIFAAEYIQQNNGNAKAGIEQAISIAAGTGIGVVILSGPDIYLTEPVVVSQPGVTIRASNRNMRIFQETWGLPVFLVTADSVTIEGVRCFNRQPRSRIVNFLTGWNFATTYNQRTVARDYAAGVVSLNCHRTVVRGCYFQGFFTGVTFFGFYNGGSGYARGFGHRMLDCETRDCDMGMLAYLTDSAVIDGCQFADIPWTQPTAPPHGCYFSVEREGDGSYPEGDDHINLTYTNNSCVNNPYSSGHKFKAVKGLVVDNIIADNCERGFDIDYCFNGKFSNLHIPAIATYVWPTAATHPQFLATTTDQNRYNGGVINDSQCSGINIVDSQDHIFTNVSIDKGGVNDCDGILIREGSNVPAGGCGRVTMKGVKFYANNEPGTSQIELTAMAYVPVLETAGVVDLTNDCFTTRMDPVSTSVPDGSPIVLRQPLPNSTLSGGLALNTVYFSKQSSQGTNKIELHTTSALNSRVDITSAGTGQLRFETGVILPGAVNTGTDQINLGSGVTATAIFANATAIRVAAPSGGTLPGGLNADTTYYTSGSGSNLQLYTDAALTQLVDITSAGSGVMVFRLVKVPAGYGLHLSAATDCTIEGMEIFQRGTSSAAKGARHLRFATAIRCNLIDYRVIGTDRHGQIEADAVDCFIRVARGAMPQSSWYSSSWIDNGGTDCRAAIDANNRPIGFSSNVAAPSIGDLGQNYATNSSGSLQDITNFSGFKWDGRRIRIFSGDNLTRIAVGSISRTASANVNATTDVIELGVDANTIFADTTAVVLTSTGGLPGGISSSTTYYTKKAGATGLELYTDIGLTSKVNITSTGGGTLTIKTAASDNMIMSPGVINWQSNRSQGRWIEFTYRALESKWVQTGSSDAPTQAAATYSPPYNIPVPNGSSDNNKLLSASGSGTYALVTAPTGKTIVNDATSYSAISNSTAETTVASLTLTAGVLTSDGDWWELSHNAAYLNNTGGTTQFTVAVKIGATTIYQSITSTISAASGTRIIQIFGRLKRLSATTGHLELRFLVGSASSATTGTGALSGAAISSAAEATGFTIDWSQSNTLSLTVTLASAATTHTYTPRNTSARA